jgi:hypothetical protein
VRYLIFNYDTKEDVAVFLAATEIVMTATLVWEWTATNYSCPRGSKLRFELKLSSFSKRRSR